MQKTCQSNDKRQNIFDLPVRSESGGKNSIPLSILIGHFSVENNHSTIFEYISGTYLVTYLPQRYCVYPI